MPEIEHTDAYYCNSDIDWFCQINGINIHVASLGHEIPKNVEMTLKVVYEKVSKIDMAPWKGREGIWYNEELVRRALRKLTISQEGESVQDADNMEVARYLATYVVMARKGFYSFAPLTTDPTDRNYYLMAKPVDYKHKEIEGIFMTQLLDYDVKGIDGWTALPLEEMIER